MTLNKKQKLELLKVVQKCVLNTYNYEMFIKIQKVYEGHKDLMVERVLELLTISTYDYYAIVQALGLRTDRNVNIKRNTNFLEAFNALF